MHKNLLIALLLLICTAVYSQNNEIRRLQKPKPVSKSDTATTPKILKEWTLSTDFSEEVPLEVDTAFSLFQRYRKADRYSPLNAMLGNYGLPFYQISFFDRVTDPDKFLYSYYYPLMYVPDRAVFMNTQVPFTDLFWTFGGQRQNSEQTFRIWHTQNVNRYLNFGLIYDIIYSLGQYNYQRADDKDFTFFSSYIGERYKLYFSAGINNINSNENGGIPDFGQLSQQSNMRDVPVRLGGTSTALSTLKNRSLLLVQRYSFGNVETREKDSTGTKKKGFLGLSGTFSHIFTLESNKRTYSDKDPHSGFYDTSYVSSAQTFDSLSSRIIRNTLRFDFTTDPERKFRLGGGAGIRTEAFRYGQTALVNDSTRLEIPARQRLSHSITGKLYNSIGSKFKWSATGDLYFFGYRAGDLQLNGLITKSFDLKKGRADWNIMAGMSSRSPSYWYQNWMSNNFIWSNNLNKEFRLNAGTSFIYPSRKMSLKFNYTIIDNYTDFDTAAYPAQHNGGISVAALSAGKEMKLWKFHLASDVIIQQSSNRDIIDLPLVALRSAGYFEHLFRFKSTGGELNTQLGAEVMYNTPYHAYAYMPATGRFYRQDTETTGSYPFINAFVNLKIKRTRIFLMMDHLNAGMMGYGFNMVPSYPMNMRMFRYGLSWTFYD